MFIKKDSRKVVEVLLDDSRPLTSLSLGRREPEFRGDTALLLGGEGAAARLAGTQSLSLYGNALRSLSGWEALSGSALRTLDLGNNQLAALPASFGALHQLERLWLEDNALAEFPRPLLRCTALRALRLSGNGLARLPRGIGALEALEELAVDNNELTVLPDELCSLRRLRTLLARGNHLQALPARLGALAALETLVLSSNELAALPASLGRLRRLATLLVNSNRLATLPAALARLPALRKLNAANNPIEALPAALLEALGHALPPHVAAAARRVAELRELDGGAEEEEAEEAEEAADEEGGGSSGEPAGATAAAAAAAGVDAAPRKVVFLLGETPLAKRAEQLVAAEEAAGDGAKRARVG